MGWIPVSSPSWHYIVGRSARFARNGPNVLVLVVVLLGCVERKLLVRSDPPGATIYVDGELKGKTPEEGALELPFEFYGTRTVLARHPGFVPLRRDVGLDPPWWQYFPVDLLTDVVWPGTIEDTHELDLVLTPRGEPEDPAELENRARHFAESEGRRP